MPSERQGERKVLGTGCEKGVRERVRERCKGQVEKGVRDRVRERSKRQGERKV